MAISFEVLKKDKNTSARAGILKTPHGEIRTPVFMPVGTNATVKAMTVDDLREIGADIILSNAYHLYLRPGIDVIENIGGLHKFMNWNGSILTDSGGFQIFSLAKNGLKIDNEGVISKSPIDGSELKLTPEKVVEIQEKLGSDIAMVLDECPPYNTTKEKVRIAVDRTTNWAKRSKKALTSDMALFGIVQGGIYSDLRKISAEEITDIDFPGYAIGGLSVGESREEMVNVLKEITPVLPEDKPRYLMGVGDPMGLIEAIKNGIDMFDCVLPTRTARNARLFTYEGEINIRNSKYKNDKGPIDANCTCKVCKNYSRAYIRHLFQAGEILGANLATFHNLSFIINLVDEIRESIFKENVTTNSLNKVKSLAVIQEGNEQ